MTSKCKSPTRYRNNASYFTLSGKVFNHCKLLFLFHNFHGYHKCQCRRSKMHYEGTLFNMRTQMVTNTIEIIDSLRIKASADKRLVGNWFLYIYMGCWCFNFLFNFVFSLGICLFLDDESKDCILYRIHGDRYFRIF